MRAWLRAHPDPAGERGPAGEPLPIGALLRLAADDELTPEERERLGAYLAAHPEEAERIEFERSLRCACERACCPCGCAPPGLRERIIAAAHAGPQAGQHAGPVQSGRESGAGFGQARFLARFAAAAAIVALVAGAGFLAGRAEQRNERLSDLGAPPTGRVLAASLARFVRDEHRRCVEGGPPIESKFSITETEGVPREFSEIVGRPVTIPCIARAEQHGLRFVDAGLCHPPGGDALHVRFRTEAGEGSLVSLWVQGDDGRLDIEDGVTYTLGDGADRIRFWRVDGIRYVLVCPDEAAAPGVSLALASPAAVRAF